VGDAAGIFEISSDIWVMSDSVLQAISVNEAMIIVEKDLIIVIIVVIVFLVCNENIC